MILKRELQNRILKSIKNTSVTAILGARQVGKTTLAKSIIKEFKNVQYLDLEKNTDLALLNDEEQYFNYNKKVSLFCIDEIQLKPEIYRTLRSFVDENPENRFLILGSASPSLLRQTSESLAGRIFYYELNPLNYNELKNVKTLNEYHLLGGFPKSVLAIDNEVAFEWLENFIKTFLERDLQMFGYRIPPTIVRRLWVMLAHINGQLLNYAMLSRSMGIDEKTIKKYIHILKHTFMIRILQPYFVNVKKRLTKTPKIYFKDTGVLHSLLGINTYNDLYSNPIFGSSWETLIIDNIISKFYRWEHYFYRTAIGSEIDLVLVKGKEIIAIEIKSNSVPKVKKGFWTALEDIKATKSFIIAPVKQVYPYKKGVMVYPIDEFLKLEL